MNFTEVVLDTIADDSIDAVLQVLLLTVFADRKAWDEEFTAVREAVPNLAIFTQNEVEVPDEGLDSLIVRHAAQVRALMDETDYLSSVNKALRRITNPMLMPMMLTAMNEIAGSDANIHNAETSLIDQADALWNGGV